MSLTYKQCIKKYEGQGIDWDGVSPYQCVDWAKCYVQEVWGVITKGKGTSPWGNAKEYYTNFNNKSWGGYKKFHDAHFVRIANTSDFIPMKGDVLVWGNGEYGHIAVMSDKKATTSYFYSYDQNWGGKYVQLVKHNYNNFLGVLRPPRTVKANVNVRKGAGTKYDIVDELEKGTKVTVYESSGNWARIGENKWISSKYLETI